MAGRVKELVFPIWKIIYRLSIVALWPINFILSKKFENLCSPDSVLHISYMVHIPYYTVRTLRRFGLKADYMAVGKSKVWKECDYQVLYSRWPFVRAWQEFRWFWQIVARYEIIHLHFMVLLSYTGWELPLLKKMGRKIVVHYRGCEIRNRRKMMQLYPDDNICQECDYNAVNCEHPGVLQRRALAQRYGDSFLVTTPDLKEFIPEAIHLPFLVPEIDPLSWAGDPPRRANPRPLKMVLVTNHPKIEGTAQIQKIVADLQAKGYPIEMILLTGVSHERVLKEYASADLAIGKMKMGYYANAQIESMLLGVPTITFVRPQFMTEELKKSEFILTSLKELPEVLEYYLNHPEALEEKRKKAKESILKLHDNEKIARVYIQHYASLKNPKMYPPTSSSAYRS
jgi:hypothetical protein